MDINEFNETSLMSFPKGRYWCTTRKWSRNHDARSITWYRICVQRKWRDLKLDSKYAHQNDLLNNWSRKIYLSFRLHAIFGVVTWINTLKVIIDMSLTQVCHICEFQITSKGSQGHWTFEFKILLFRKNRFIQKLSVSFFGCEPSQRYTPKWNEPLWNFIEDFSSLQLFWIFETCPKNHFLHAKAHFPSVTGS